MKILAANFASRVCRELGSLRYQMEIKFELDVVDDRKHHHHLRLLHAEIAEFDVGGGLAGEGVATPLVAAGISPGEPFSPNSAYYLS